MPISDCEVRDPRIRRTRQALQGALRELMQTKSIEEISVQDITDLADVNRATFYDHYNDKFACWTPWSPAASTSCWPSATSCSTAPVPPPPAPSFLRPATTYDHPLQWRLQPQQRL